MILFIADLHLSSMDKALNDRFDNFLENHACFAKALYILGDFFDKWVGDDGMDEWSLTIAKKLAKLVKAGVLIYLVPGNRDFLIGLQFASLAHCVLLKDPHLLLLEDKRILLMHGDSLCTLDKIHQGFRGVTQHIFFKKCFMHLPLSWRKNMVGRVRNYSASHNKDRFLEEKKSIFMDVVEKSVENVMKKWNVSCLIHGHTHKPYEHIMHQEDGSIKIRWVLSDWHDELSFLCYDKSIGFYLKQL